MILTTHFVALEVRRHMRLAAIHISLLLFLPYLRTGAQVPQSPAARIDPSRIVLQPIPTQQPCDTNLQLGELTLDPPGETTIHEPHDLNGQDPVSLQP